MLGAVVMGGGCTARSSSRGVPSSRVSILVDQPVALADVPVSIKVAGLKAGARIVLHADAALLSRQDSSAAAFTADHSGTVDVASTPAVSGSYTGRDGMGLFWSMKDSGPAAVPGPVGRFVVKLSVEAAGQRVASTEVTRLLETPGESVQKETLAGEGFIGTFFGPPTGTRLPAVLVFGGSEGGMTGSAVTAAMLAARGYPALAVAYFGLPGLPTTLANIPLEYFAGAARWLARQPQVDPSRVWVLSGSRGSEAALLTAVHFPQLVHGVVAFAPSSVAYGSLDGLSPGWTLAGRALPHGAIVYSAIGHAADGAVIDSPAFQAGLTDPASQAAAIPVEQIHGPILTMAGGDDQLWPSPTYAAQIMARLDAHHFPYPHQQLTYPAAGHVVFGVPLMPSPPLVAHLGGYDLLLGGTVEADEAAHADAWPKVLAYLAAH